MNTPTPNTPTQPSLGALRAAREINEQLGTENVVIAQNWLCEVIDRETGTAALLEHLSALVDCYGVGWKSAEACQRALEPLMSDARAVIKAHKARTP